MTTTPYCCYCCCCCSFIHVFKPSSCLCFYPSLSYYQKSFARNSAGAYFPTHLLYLTFISASVLCPPSPPPLLSRYLILILVEHTTYLFTSSSVLTNFKLCMYLLYIMCDLHRSLYYRFVCFLTSGSGSFSSSSLSWVVEHLGCFWIVGLRTLLFLATIHYITVTMYCTHTCDLLLLFAESSISYIYLDLADLGFSDLDSVNLWNRDWQATL